MHTVPKTSEIGAIQTTVKPKRYRQEVSEKLQIHFFFVMTAGKRNCDMPEILSVLTWFIAGDDTVCIRALAVYVAWQIAFVWDKHYTEEKQNKWYKDPIIRYNTVPSSLRPHTQNLEPPNVQPSNPIELTRNIVRCTRSHHHCNSLDPMYSILKASEHNLMMA